MASMFIASTFIDSPIFRRVKTAMQLQGIKVTRFVKTYTHPATQQEIVRYDVTGHIFGMKIPDDPKIEIIVHLRNTKPESDPDYDVDKITKVELIDRSIS